MFVAELFNTGNTQTFLCSASLDYSIWELNNIGAISQ